jgi:hypothetical protein
VTENTDSSRTAINQPITGIGEAAHDMWISDWRERERERDWKGCGTDMQRKVRELGEFSSIFVIKIPSFLTFLCHNFLSCSNVDKLLYFLGTFAKFRKATISFVMSVRPHGTRLPLDGFS